MITGTLCPDSVNSLVGTSAVRYRAKRGKAGNKNRGATIGKKSTGASKATATSKFASENSSFTKVAGLMTIPHKTANGLPVPYFVKAST